MSASGPSGPLVFSDRSRLLGSSGDRISASPAAMYINSVSKLRPVFKNLDWH